MSSKSVSTGTKFTECFTSTKYLTISDDPRLAATWRRGMPMYVIAHRNRSADKGRLKCSDPRSFSERFAKTYSKVRRSPYPALRNKSMSPTSEHSLMFISASDELSNTLPSLPGATDPMFLRLAALDFRFLCFFGSHSRDLTCSRSPMYLSSSNRALSSKWSLSNIHCSSRGCL